MRPVLGDLELLALEAARGRVRSGGVDDRRGGDALGRLGVLLEEERRHREHVADPVEAVADVVGGEAVARAVVHEEQVADRVPVLEAVQPSQRHASGVAGDRRRRGRLDRAVERREEALPRRGVGLARVLGRHLLRRDAGADLPPEVEAVADEGPVGDRRLERRQVEAPRLERPVVAGDAVRGEDDADVVRELPGSSPGGVPGPARRRRRGRRRGLRARGPRPSGGNGPSDFGGRRGRARPHRTRAGDDRIRIRPRRHGGLVPNLPLGPGWEAAGAADLGLGPAPGRRRPVPGGDRYHAAP